MIEGKFLTELREYTLSYRGRNLMIEGIFLS